MVLIKKHSGETEEYDPAKVRGAIIRAGAAPDLADRIIADVETHLYNGISTKEIYGIAFHMLDRE